MTLQQKMIRAIGCLGVLAGSVQAAHAQAVTTTFDELAGKLKTGSAVAVTDETGRKIAGKVTALSASSLRLLSGGEEKTFAVPQIREISRRQRLTGQGALIGLFAGAILGFVSTAQGCHACGDQAGGFALAGAMALGGLGAGVGAGIGAGITRDQPLYQPPAPGRASVVMTPRPNTHGTGVALSLRF